MIVFRGTFVSKLNLKLHKNKQLKKLKNIKLTITAISFSQTVLSYLVNL